MLARVDADLRRRLRAASGRRRRYAGVGHSPDHFAGVCRQEFSAGGAAADRVGAAGAGVFLMHPRHRSSWALRRLDGSSRRAFGCWDGFGLGWGAGADPRQGAPLSGGGRRQDLRHAFPPDCRAGSRRRGLRTRGVPGHAARYREQSGLLVEMRRRNRLHRQRRRHCNGHNMFRQNLLPCGHPRGRQAARRRSRSCVGLPGCGGVQHRAPLTGVQRPHPRRGHHAFRHHVALRRRSPRFAEGCLRWEGGMVDRHGDAQ
mmetsp:Transcript_1701/g.4799  ORF Transcript_1701/g.4799 Transcript_1701/m.4799 type:complete len:258 (+) Transcript_1701:569-1342(+)